jgi:CP family cyanate transporter-like MFS transporter
MSGPAPDTVAETVATVDGVRPRATDAALLLALALVAMNLRTGFTSVSAVLEELRADLGLSYAATGLLTVLPTLCMGAVALVGAWLARIAGPERGIGAALLLIAAGSALRFDGRWLAALFGGTLLLGLGLATAQVLVPTLAKYRVPHRIPLAMGLFTAAMNLGALLAGVLTAPLARLLDSWALALAAWSLPALLAWWVWRRVVAQTRTDWRGEILRVSLPWRSAPGWRITGLLGLSTAVYVSLLAWLAPLYQAQGWSATRAGTVVGVFTLGQIAGALLAPVLAGHHDDRRPGLTAALLVMIGALLGLSLAPTLAPWLWACAAGVAMGGSFPLLLALPLDYARGPEGAARLTAMAFGIGVILAAPAPYLVGTLRDLSGDYRLPYLALTALVTVNLALIARCGPPKGDERL